MMVNMPSVLHAVTRSAGTLETTAPLYPAATPVPANDDEAAGAAVVAAGPQAVREKAAITSRINILKAKLLVRISSNLLNRYYDFSAEPYSVERTYSNIS